MRARRRNTPSPLCVETSPGVITTNNNSHWFRTISNESSYMSESIALDSDSSRSLTMNSSSACQAPAELRKTADTSSLASFATASSCSPASSSVGGTSQSPRISAGNTSVGAAATSADVAMAPAEAATSAHMAIDDAQAQCSGADDNRDMSADNSRRFSQYRDTKPT